MKLKLSLILTLLCAAGAAWAEDDLEKFQPSLYCDPVPDGRVIVEKDGRHETAGKQIYYHLDGINYKLEERYITMKGQKCAVKIFGILSDDKHQKKDMLDIPTHGSFEDALRSKSYLNTKFYYSSLFDFVSKETEFLLCLDQNDSKNMPSKICRMNADKNLNDTGFVGYYFIPRIYGIQSCIFDACPISGFYFIDGKLGLLDKSVPLDSKQEYIFLWNTLIE